MLSLFFFLSRQVIIRNHFFFIPDISAFGTIDSKKTSIFNQPCFLPPLLTDLQPVKIQLNNSVHSAFPIPFCYTRTLVRAHTRTVQAHVRTNTPWWAPSSMIYGLWLLHVGNVFSRLTADLYLCLHFVFRFSVFSYLLQLNASGWKLINCFPCFSYFSKGGNKLTWILKHVQEHI